MAQMKQQHDAEIAELKKNIVPRGQQFGGIASVGYYAAGAVTGVESQATLDGLKAELGQHQQILFAIAKACSSPLWTK